MFVTVTLEPDPLSLFCEKVIEKNLGMRGQLAPQFDKPTYTYLQFVMNNHQTLHVYILGGHNSGEMA